MSARPITFLSDYGYEDEFAGVCRAVVARIAPAAALVDLTHGVPPGDVRHGAVALVDALPHAPEGVHLAVVDPGVGTARRSVAVQVAEGDRVLVGPDNGLLWPAAGAFGGPASAVDIAASPFRLEPVSATFHGRDVFAPVAARIALGASLEQAGEAIEPGTLVRLDLPGARIEPDRVTTEVVRVDRFGNAALGVRAEQLGDAFRTGGPVTVEAGAARRAATLAHTFGDVAEGQLMVYADSSGRLALGVNRGNAAVALRVAPGDGVVIRA